MSCAVLLADLVALVGGTVHSMVPGEAPREATILIRDGVIEAVGADLELPPGTERYDLEGRHVVPGLIDGMVHFDPDHDLLYVVHGVTTVRDMGGVMVTNLLERAAERRDRAPGPNLLTAGALIDGDPPGSAEAVVVRDAEAADAFLPILFDRGVDLLSIHLALSPAAWRRVVSLAHAEGVEVWGPVPREVGFGEAIEEGQDGIVYLDRLLPEVDGVDWTNVQPAALRPAVEALAANGVTLVPILQAGALRTQDQRLVLDLLRLMRFSYENWWLGELKTRLDRLDERARAMGGRILEKQRALLVELHAAGVPLLPGSASPHPWLFPGQALHQEMHQWVEAGLEPGEVLRLATHGAAEILGIASERGSIAPGRVADLVVVEGDPLDDLGVLVAPEIVVVRGRVIERREGEDLLASLAARFDREREELARPLEVEPPPAPSANPGMAPGEPGAAPGTGAEAGDGPAASAEPAALVLEGLVETRALRQRLSSERFRVYRTQAGETVYSGRIVYPGDGSAGEGSPASRELLVEQVVADGELARFRVRLSQDGEELVLQGLWTAERMRMERRLNGAFVDSRSSTQRPACLDVGSATSVLVLGQHPTGTFPVLSLHEGLEPEFANWTLELDERAQHQVRTHTGRMAFRFQEKGAPELWHVRVGQGIVETVLLEAKDFGGPGHPLPPDKAPAQAAQPAQTEPAELPGEEKEAPADGAAPPVTGEDSDSPRDGSGG